MLYDLTWKDVMYILGQTLTPDSKPRVLGKAVAYGDEWLGNESVGKREDELAELPTRNQVVLTTEPGWDYNVAKGGGIRVILSDVFLKDSGKHVLRLQTMPNWQTQNRKRRKVNS